MGNCYVTEARYFLQWCVTEGGMWTGMTQGMQLSMKQNQQRWFFVCFDNGAGFVSASFIELIKNEVAFGQLLC